MKKHCYIFLLASILILASQPVQGNKYIYTSPRVYNLEQYILSANPVKQKAQIEGDQEELALYHEGKIWKAKVVGLRNWAKRNPGKAVVCGLATAAAIGGLGYLAWNHWHLPTQQAPTTAVAIYNPSPRPNIQNKTPSIEPLCPISAPTKQAQTTAVAVYNPYPRPNMQNNAPSTELLCPLPSVTASPTKQAQSTALVVYNKYSTAPHSTTSASPQPELKNLIPVDIRSFLRNWYKQQRFLQYIRHLSLNCTE